MPFVAPKKKIQFRFRLTPSDTRIEFPAYLQDLSVQVSPTWEGYNEIGRADNKYIYSTFGKSLSIAFLVPAENSQAGDMTINRVFDKLDALAKAATPYTSGAGYVGQFIIFTIGEIYVNQVGYVTSLTYDWDNSTTTWDIDKQLPMLTNVSLSIQWVGRTMARGNTSFFSLGKEISYQNNRDFV